MDTFWSRIYDDIKDRRYGTLFIAAFFIGTPLLLLGVCLANATFAELMDLLSGLPDLSTFQLICLVLLTGAVLVVLALLFSRWIRIARKLRCERSKFSRLSRDELLKARSKLKSQTNPVKFRLVQRPAKRAAHGQPDTDLKY